ncbi:MAG: hypothetical protein A2836_03570 [Candidatus Taylorbacteria bacterium RIFCSPHIGHO2_01_FULL_45_63]|uniref:Histidyl-tRNA synthetase n=1 Tax=Candidatus Taylorbacteria bacterium RIFCSPHIGHO2_02_FULL_45_35 TaxID=1802311 RepID=A0A1G2MQM8_9BACT|nr:MAG: hypothetical protein A2836_03570 [Candidatus Taylorbacteria bacterium RIFCSPHIGHO2_01_FULL_45_63]OHA26044.1 MAG: hypothetical protein A3D56_02910 [Candidatus Taylorbacteria bacterium RIFCSPHIGHO2_02_FULL_45_35]OHA32473.1 MAG: hypothetical protein A3A22_01575 [Candidatus Taylorbacteria bacterium RIFCSPLOWO2_01_FULL_45_34b]
MPSVASTEKKSAGKNSKRKAPEFITYQNASRAEEAALYYGFSPITIPTVTKDDLSRVREMIEAESKPRQLPEGEECFLSICPEEKVALIRTYEEKELYREPQPVMLFFAGHFSTNPSRKNASKEKRYGLEILGTTKSIAEAILIKTTIEILKEEGFENLYIDINSIGDKESVMRFSKELTAYYRKNINLLPAHCRQTMKRETFDLLECPNEKCKPLQDAAPKSLGSLSEISRKHFTEVLEFLEQMNIPYRINNALVGNRHFCTHTIFEIRSLDQAEDAEGTPLAVGIRYNNLAKKIGWRRDLPALGVTIAYRKNEKNGNDPKKIKIKKPQIYFIQLGFEAKLKSLRIIEILRQAKIPMLQALSKDKLAAQLSGAEHMKIPYTILIGQKEAMEDSVIVRNMASRSQETVKIASLPEYLKKIKLA